MKPTLLLMISMLLCGLANAEEPTWKPSRFARIFDDLDVEAYAQFLRFTERLAAEKEAAMLLTQKGGQTAYIDTPMPPPPVSTPTPNKGLLTYKMKPGYIEKHPPIHEYKFCRNELIEIIKPYLKEHGYPYKGTKYAIEGIGECVPCEMIKAGITYKTSYTPEPESHYIVLKITE